MGNGRIRGLVASAGAILFWIIVWALAAALVDNPMLLAGPLEAVEALGRLAVQPASWLALGSSALLFVAAGCLSGAAGILLGLAAARFQGVHILFSPLLQAVKSAPIACIVVVLLVLLGPSGTTSAIVGFVALPPFYAAALEARRGSDPTLAAVLRLEGLTPFQAFLAAAWPASCPYYSVAAQSAVALAWRAGVMAELLGLPFGSIGAQIYGAKLTLDSAELLAWTAVVMACGWISERIVGALVNASAEASPSLAAALAARGRRKVRRGGAAGGDAHLQAAGVQVAFNPEAPVICEDIAVAPGERLCLMAPTGSGKTTLIRVLARLLMPATGHFEAPERLGIVMQGANLVESLTAAENVNLTADASRDLAQVRSALITLLPEGTLDRPAAQLSGGTRRLVEIARAAYSSGQAVILDEPFTGLDPDAKARAAAFLLQEQGRRPLLFTTHNAEDAALLSARVQKAAATSADENPNAPRFSAPSSSLSK